MDGMYVYFNDYYCCTALLYDTTAENRKYSRVASTAAVATWQWQRRYSNYCRCPLLLRHLAVSVLAYDSSLVVLNAARCVEPVTQ